VDPRGGRYALKPINEGDLVRGLRAGEETAYRQLWDRHYGAIYRHVLGKFARSRADAQDITQDTFLRAFRSAATFAGRSALRTWLFTLSHHAALDHYKVRATRYDAGEVEVPCCSEPVAVYPEPATSAAQPLDDLLQKEARDQTWARIAQLGEEQRSVLTYRLMDRFSTAETAALMNKTEGAVKMLLCRATKALLGVSARPARKPARGEVASRDA
jgi:RNA polymerase sigma-70 factor, ECF subfamily